MYFKKPEEPREVFHLFSVDNRFFFPFRGKKYNRVPRVCKNLYLIVILKRNFILSQTSLLKFGGIELFSH